MRFPTDYEALAELIFGRVPSRAIDWLRQRLEAVSARGEELEAAFSAAGRSAGHAFLIDPPVPNAVRLGEDGPILNPWRVDEAARVLLLLADAGRDPEAAMRRTVALYFRGDGRERIACLRALQLLPGGDEGLEAVRDALRANAADLFAAAICENLYTSARLPDAAFFQAVLKGVFVGLPLGRIERLEERTNAELARMLFTYVTEREAAARPVSAELWPVIALFPPPGFAERLRARVAGATASERPLLEVALERLRR